MITDALDYTRKGWRVFPCKWEGEHAKAPLTKNGHLEASQDAEVITRWWSRWPSAMIGAPVPDKLLVLDIDPRNGGNVEALGDLPPTATCWSGRGDGGRHLYFLRPAGQLTSTRLPRGIDLKVHGYCIVPPSIHPATGQPYRWEDHPIARLPHRLRELLRPAPVRLRPAVRRGDGSGLIRFVSEQPLGNVNNGLYWAACSAATDGVLDELAEALVAAAIAAGHPETGARRTVESARKKASVA
jgi:hypothetical protein